jgi:hypothetical protein
MRLFPDQSLLSFNQYQFSKFVGKRSRCLFALASEVSSVVLVPRNADATNSRQHGTPLSLSIKKTEKGARKAAMPCEDYLGVAGYVQPLPPADTKETGSQAQRQESQPSIRKRPGMQKRTHSGRCC